MMDAVCILFTFMTFSGWKKKWKINEIKNLRRIGDGEFFQVLKENLETDVVGQHRSAGAISLKVKKKKPPQDYRHADKSNR